MIAITWASLSFVGFLMFILGKNETIFLYLFVIRNMICAIMTAFMPFLFSWVKGVWYLPFPINEDCINDLEMVLNFEVPARIFFQFLIREDPESQNLSALYSDKCLYDNYIMTNQLEKAGDQVRLIQKDYFDDPHSDFYLDVPDSILQTLEKRFDSIETHLNLRMFMELDVYLMARLKRKYEQFKSTHYFKYLLNHIRYQESLYEVL